MSSMSSSIGRAFLCTVVFVSLIAGVIVLPSERVAAEPELPTILNLAVSRDIPDFNIWNPASNSIWKTQVLDWTMEGLVGNDYDMLPFGVLASSWTYDEPSMTWTFYLRQGVTFQDGSTFSAEDVVFIYGAARADTSFSNDLVKAFDWDYDGYVSESEISVSVWQEDSYTVKMMMAVPFGQFLTTTAKIPILPKSIWKNHLTYDGLVDVLWNSSDATIGTGPFRYKEGIDNAFRLLETYDGYWGKNTTTPLGYRMCPARVNQLRFGIYPSVDSAIFALQSGAVDHITWSLTASRVPSLQADQFIDLTYLADNGYFYLAFNMKFDPMGNLSFRKAVSYVIDKDQIVNDYMGGFGTKGSACEPPFWGEWFNFSVAKYLYNLDVANELLNASGYMDVNSDGWREMPDGTPMQKITILTPPADYDPVRIRAGQMIAKNMRDGLHINSEAMAIDFDTLVSRLYSMDYQMMIIGWSLTSDPIGNVFDILGPLSSLNSFGFWSLGNPNPYYSDLYGVTTRADAETQAMADEVLDLSLLARSSFDPGSQAMYTKWAEGVIADALPLNVLYYRVNIFATRAAWSGWMPYLGGLLNIFSLSQLVYVGAPVGVVGATGEVNAALSIPETVGVARDSLAYVSVIDSAGTAISGASVNVDLDQLDGSPPTIAVNPSLGTTDENGVFEFNLTGVSEGRSLVTVNVTKNSGSCSESAVVHSVDMIPATLALQVSAERSVLGLGESSIVHMSVTDEYGVPVEGATISADPYLIGYGFLDSLVVLTDVLGEAVVTYSAPSSMPMLNAHIAVTLSFHVTKHGYSWTDAASVNLLVMNNSPPDWVICQVTDVAPLYLHSGSNSTTISVVVSDQTGSSLGKRDLSVSYSNSSLLFNPTVQVVTNGAGVANLDIQFKNGIPSAGLRVEIADTSILNSVPAAVTLVYSGSDPVPTMYGGYMTWGLPAPYMGPVGSLTATAHIWDQNGDPADMVDACLVVSGTPYGTLSWCDSIYWDSTFDGWGINLVTKLDNSNTVTSGPFNTPFDYANWEENYNNGQISWDWGVMTGVQVIGGTLDIPIYGVGVSWADVIGSIYVVPGAYGWFDVSSTIYHIDGPTTISAEYVLGRSYDVVAPSYFIEDPVLSAKSSDYDETNVQIWAQDEAGLPAQAVDAIVYERIITNNQNYMVIPYDSNIRKWVSAPVTTDSNGFANETVVAIGKNYAVTSSNLQADVFVRASEFGAVSLFSQSRIFIFVQKCFVDITSITEPLLLGDIVQIEAFVTDFAGAAVSGLSASIVAEGGTVTSPSTNTSDASGRVNFTLDTSTITGYDAGFIPVRISASGPGYEYASSSMMIPFRFVDSISPTAEAGPDFSILGGEVVVFNGSGSSDNVGIVNYTWTFVYDNQSVVLYGEEVSFLFEINGVYVVTLTVADAMNNTAQDTATVTVEGYIPEFSTAVIPVCAVALVLLVLRQRRRRLNHH